MDGGGGANKRSQHNATKHESSSSDVVVVVVVVSARVATVETHRRCLFLLKQRAPIARRAGNHLRLTKRGEQDNFPRVWLS
jgi:hypothetical protein